MFACEGEVCSSVSNEHFNIFLVKINFVNFKNRLMVVQIGLGVGGLMFFVQLRCRSQHHLTRNVALFFAVQEKKAIYGLGNNDIIVVHGSVVEAEVIAHLKYLLARFSSDHRESLEADKPFIVQTNC